MYRFKIKIWNGEERKEETYSGLIACDSTTEAFAALTPREFDEQEICSLELVLCAPFSSKVIYAPEGIVDIITEQEMNQI